MWSEKQQEAKEETTDRQSQKLFGDFDALDWRRGLSVPEEAVPEALIVHGEYDAEENLNRWEQLLGPETFRPQWNIVGGVYKGRRVGFANVFGGPMAAMVVHPCCVMGTQAVIQTGYFGALSDEVDYGDILIVSSVKAGCGVSGEYGAGGGRLEADERLVQKARAYCEDQGWSYVVGEVRSTDAICLETNELVQRWAEDGQVGVDMECSATFSVAAKFDRPVVGVLNLSDHLVRGDHLMNYDDERREVEGEVDERIRELALALVG